jgi:hypothetical protein
MESTLLISLLLLLLFLWLFIRRRSNQAATRQARPKRRTTAFKNKTAYHAVSLKFPRDACAAAKALQGERFLSSDAPTLPLADCDAAQCECSFVHHGDRRSGKDRRNVFTASGYSAATGRFEHERRQGADRRNDNDT